jgi:hypothetical protein
LQKDISNFSVFLTINDYSTLNLTRGRTSYMRYFKYIMVLLPFALGSCQWFEDLGEHMPVIGERCDHWQCFTESGQEASKRTIEYKNNPTAEPTPAEKPAAVPKPAGSTPYDTVQPN